MRLKVFIVLVIVFVILFYRYLYYSQLVLLPDLDSIWSGIVGVFQDVVLGFSDFFSSFKKVKW